MLQNFGKNFQKTTYGASKSPQNQAKLRCNIAYGTFEGFEQESNLFRNCCLFSETAVPRQFQILDLWCSSRLVRQQEVRKSTPKPLILMQPPTLIFLFYMVKLVLRPKQSSVS